MLRVYHVPHLDNSAYVVNYKIKYANERKEIVNSSEPAFRIFIISFLKNSAIADNKIFRVNWYGKAD